MLMLILGESDAIETNVNASVKTKVNTDTQCEWILNLTLISIKVKYCLIYYYSRLALCFEPRSFTNRQPLFFSVKFSSCACATFLSLRFFVSHHLLLLSMTTNHFSNYQILATPNIHVVKLLLRTHISSFHHSISGYHISTVQQCSSAHTDKRCYHRDIVHST